MRRMGKKTLPLQGTNSIIREISQDNLCRFVYAVVFFSISCPGQINRIILWRRFTFYPDCDRSLRSGQIVNYVYRVGHTWTIVRNHRHSLICSNWESNFWFGVYFASSKFLLENIAQGLQEKLSGAVFTFFHKSLSRHLFCKSGIRGDLNCTGLLTWCVVIGVVIFVVFSFLIQIHASFLEILLLLFLLFFFVVVVNFKDAWQTKTFKSF